MDADATRQMITQARSELGATTTAGWEDIAAWASVLGILMTDDLEQRAADATWIAHTHEIMLDLLDGYEAALAGSELAQKMLDAEDRRSEDLKLAIFQRDARIEQLETAARLALEATANGFLERPHPALLDASKILKSALEETDG